MTSDDDHPAPASGFVVPRFLVVSDQDRSRDFYVSVFGATVVAERDPVILKIANSWLILNVGGGPTDDKPTVTVTKPADRGRRRPHQCVPQPQGGRHRPGLCGVVGKGCRVPHRTQGPRARDPCLY